MNETSENLGSDATKKAAVADKSDNTAEQETNTQENEKGRRINLKDLNHIPVEVSIVLGKKIMSVNDLAGLTPGDVVEFNRDIEEPVDICANNMIIAKGDIVVADDKVGIKIIDIVT